MKKPNFVLSDCTAVGRGRRRYEYKMSGVTVRSFNQAKYLSLGKHASVKEVDDTGEVVNEVVSDGAGGAKVVKGEIVAVVTGPVRAVCISPI